MRPFTFLAICLVVATVVQIGLVVYLRSGL